MVVRGQMEHGGPRCLHDSEHERQTQERLSSLETTAWDLSAGEAQWQTRNVPRSLCDRSHGIEPSTEDGEQEKAYTGACCCGCGLEHPALEPEGVCTVDMKKR